MGIFRTLTKYVTIFSLGVYVGVNCNAQENKLEVITDEPGIEQKLETNGAFIYESSD